MSLIKTVGDALKIHKEMMIHEDRFNDRYKTIWKNLLGHFGNMDVSNIPKYEVEKYYREQTALRKVKKATVAKEVAMLNASLNYCYKLEYINTKPRTLEISCKGEIRNVWLTLPEISKILNSTRMKRNPQIEKACKIALTTTARKSAIQNLRVEQIKWNEGKRGLIDYNSKDMKNKAKPRAIVPIPKSIEKMLRECCEKSRFGWVLETRRGNKISDPLHILKQCVKDVNIDKDVCFHTLRHTGAVHMAKNSVPLLELSRYMGHTSIEVTERVYAKFYPDFMEKSSEIAGELINAH